jgi:hypothetical protein
MEYWIDESSTGIASLVNIRCFALPRKHNMKIIYLSFSRSLFGPPLLHGDINIMSSGGTEGPGTGESSHHTAHSEGHKESTLLRKSCNALWSATAQAWGTNSESHKLVSYLEARSTSDHHQKQATEAWLLYFSSTSRQVRREHIKSRYKFYQRFDSMTVSRSIGTTDSAQTPVPYGGRKCGVVYLFSLVQHTDFNAVIFKETKKSRLIRKRFWDATGSIGR